MNNDSQVTRGVAQAHEMSVALEREGQARIVAERRLQGSVFGVTVGGDLEVR